MTEKDQKGATAPPAIAPRTPRPRPSTAKAKTTGPVPAPPSGTPAPASPDAGVGADAPSAASGPGATSTVSPVEVTDAPARPQSATSSAPSPDPVDAPGVGGPAVWAPGAPAAGSPSAGSPSAGSPTAPASLPGASLPGGETAAPAAGPALGGPRKVRLSLARVDPWSVMKLSFLLSVAGGIMLIVASWVFWYALNDMGVFTQIDEMVRDIVGAESTLDILQYVERDKVLSIATLVAVVDVVLLTALGTIGAFLYNVTAALVGGLHVTLTDD